MSDHGGHGGHGDHSHGHDHGHGHGHEEHWGDYNAKGPGPNRLPYVSGVSLAVFGLALVAMLSTIVLYSVRVANKRHDAHTTEHKEGGHHEEGAHDESHGHAEAE